jgi:SNF2 family DNA or RNA helicase
LWGWHREVYDIWLKEMEDLKPAMYTGSETAAQKDREKKRFISGETKLLIMSLRSGAGIDDLQHYCSTGVFGELDWSPGIHQQCIWRIDREGQTKPVTAFFLVTDDGSDPPIMDVLGIKASEATQIVDPHLGVQVTDNDTTNLRRLVDRYLEKRSEAA